MYQSGTYRKKVNEVIISEPAPGPTKTPGKEKRKHMASRTPYYADAYISILAGESPAESDDGELSKDVYSSIQSSRTEASPAKTSRVSKAKLCYVYVQTGKYDHAVMFVRISPVPHKLYPFILGQEHWHGEAIMIEGKNMY